MGCAGSSEGNVLEEAQSIYTGLLTMEEAGRTTLVDSRTALVVGGLGVCVLDTNSRMGGEKLSRAAEPSHCVAAPLSNHARMMPAAFTAGSTQSLLRVAPPPSA